MEQISNCVKNLTIDKPNIIYIFFFLINATAFRNVFFSKITFNMTDLSFQVLLHSGRLTRSCNKRECHFQDTSCILFIKSFKNYSYVYSVKFIKACILHIYTSSIYNTQIYKRKKIRFLPVSLPQFPPFFLWFFMTFNLLVSNLPTTVLKLKYYIAKFVCKFLALLLTQ